MVEVSSKCSAAARACTRCTGHGHAVEQSYEAEFARSARCSGGGAGDSRLRQCGIACPHRELGVLSGTTQAEQCSLASRRAWCRSPFEAGHGGSPADAAAGPAARTANARPRTPHLNGKVERSDWIDDQEFYQLLDKDGITDDIHLFNDKLREWEDYYNYQRPHGALDGQTPYERLALN